MDVSIIVVNWNTCEFLRQCIDSVYAHTRYALFEIIVVDNASEDGSVDMLRREFPAVIRIENQQNRGFAAGNNEGILAARGKYVLLLNPDTRVFDLAIDRAFRFAEEHPRAAVVGCRVHDLRDNKVQFTCHEFPSLTNLAVRICGLADLAPRSRFFGRAMMTWWDYDDVREVEAVAGCFMFVRREAIRGVGMLDEDYFMYGEDIDWCFRFGQAGWKVLFCPDVEIEHFTGESSKKCSRAMEVERRRSLMLFFTKHRGGFVAFLANGLFVINELLRLGWWGLVWAVKVARGRCAEQERSGIGSKFARLRFHLSGRAVTRGGEARSNR